MNGFKRIDAVKSCSNLKEKPHKEAAKGFCCPDDGSRSKAESTCHS